MVARLTQPGSRKLEGWLRGSRKHLGPMEVTPTTPGEKLPASHRTTGRKTRKGGIGLELSMVKKLLQLRWPSR